MKGVEESCRPQGAADAGGSAPRQPPTPIRLGVDRILDGSGPTIPPSWKVGFVTSHGAPPGPGRPGPSRARLLDAGVGLARLFSPEHGLSSSAADGASVPDGADAETGLPVVSLYGPRTAPAPEDLADLDLILFDLQDAGARFYTILWTLFQVMAACARARVPLWVLDRPNPLGGKEADVEGPLPDAHLPPSFLAGWPIPLRHSLTLGEMALLLRKEAGLELELEVIPMEGWERWMHWPDTGLPFRPPSPGLPTPESVAFYPGLALLEATNLLEGRGTRHAFRWVGAPWLDPEPLMAVMDGWQLPGVAFGPHPLRSEGKAVPGVLLRAVEPQTIRPAALGLRLLALVRSLYPQAFRWTPYPTQANPSGKGHLLHLLRSAELTRILEKEPGTLSRERVAEATRAPGWWERVDPHLLYD